MTDHYPLDPADEPCPDAERVIALREPKDPEMGWSYMLKAGPEQGKRFWAHPDDPPWTKEAALAAAREALES